ncbi:MAG: hypothetical protein ABL973_06410 [Micropepsaceae bacterium]
MIVEFLRTLMWLTAFFSILPCPVRAEGLSSDSALLQGLGLDGRWAQNCSDPPAANNAFLVYLAPDDVAPSVQYYEDPGDITTFPLSDVRQLKNGDIEWVQAEGEVMITLVTQVRGNRLRTWSAANSEGQAYVVRGKYSNGGQTPWFNKCETN